MRVLIPDAESGHALGVIQSLLLQKGVVIIALSTQKRYAARFMGKNSGLELASGASTGETMIDAILGAAHKHSVDIIVPVAERATGLLAKCSNDDCQTKRTIPIPSYDSFRIATDKLRLAEFCANNGIPHPHTALVQGVGAMVESIPGGFGFPVMLKPVRGEGGKGIILITNEAELIGTDFETRRRLFGDVVVQEFIEGYDIDLSLLAVGGEIRAYTIQRGILGRKSRFAASGGIEFVHSPQLLDVASSVVHALNYSGVAHLDFRYDQRDGSFRLVDMNCRFWGSLLGSLKSGVNFPWLACQLGLGAEIEFKGFDEGRYFDLLSVARAPFSAARLRIRPSETNLEFWARAPWANVANAIFRRASLASPEFNRV